MPEESDRIKRIRKHFQDRVSAPDERSRKRQEYFDSVNARYPKERNPFVHDCEARPSVPCSACSWRRSKNRFRTRPPRCTPRDGRKTRSR
jgi:hypothetical protein